jgi:transcription termination factor Rho
VSQSTPAGTSGSLASLRIPELQSIAQQLGVKGISKMRKSDLISAISAAQSGGSAPKSAARKTASKAPVKETAPKQAVEEKPAIANSASAETASGETEAPARARRSTQRGDRTRTDRAERTEKPSRSENASDNAESAGAQGEGDNAVVVGGVKIELPSAETPERRRNDRNERNNGRNRNRNRNENGEGNDNSERNERQDRGNRNDRNRNSGEDEGRNERNDRNDRQDRYDDGDDRGNRRRRGRDRDRDRNRDRKGRNRNRNNDLAFDEADLSEDDVLIPVAGVLDLLDNYAFVRTSGYLPGPNDVYVSLGQVKKAGLRRGDAITGAVRQPRDGDQGNQRQKFNALVRLDSVNGMSPEESRNRPDFNKLTPLYPQERLRLESPENNKIAPRLIDIVAPIGKGQRGLIVAPPKAGKTIIMQQIANSITANNPEVHLMVVLVDERPEEVTDMERTVAGEVIASTFDRPASDHTIVAELAIERAKRLVELGQDVVVLLDSITRLGRAYNLAAPASGRILSGGVDAAALYPPKKFFGAARNIENGGSLTILASALVETGSKMDEVIFEEFKGTGNMELRLSRHLADRRVFPAVDVNASGTRREEILVSPEELKITYKLRRVLHNLEQGQALELLIKKLKENKTNVEFLLNIQKTTPDSLVDLDND